ncbi:hypothetical protein ASPZODRAFT_55456 [Penicilliopsis zonata CBS 506.65]|uniref:Thioredoxin-like fold domain-containing protein n=1 Tax=Penicilliopsis zonata CBS 506.65 TaxID=1073090 RepID=A0A1L9SUF6_9EURO|nr:hypothetical protein ASPZODRAFT_55456 [Penicilliopsis zonata CBS 506.65]OJJ50754.1 hypothetical protein ASPZODRAFT_55456 [Penicilliopsis zonata CBS 506.65]
MSTTRLTLYRGWLDPGKYVWSPFVIKLEARLRFAGISYKTEGGSPKSGPKGKIPYVELYKTEDPTASTSLGDSTLIIRHLVEQGILPDLNGRLVPSARAEDLAIRALMEEKLCFYHTRERWTENYHTMRDHILSSLPYPVRVVVGLLIYRNTIQTLHGQGSGRHSADEIREFRHEIWTAISDLLVASRSAKPRDPTQPFWILGGEQPTEADATVFAFVVSVLICTAGPESQGVVKEFPVLEDYAQKIHDRYFPDYVKWSDL